MTLDRRDPSVNARIRALEERAIRADDLHASLLHADSQTAGSVDKLTQAINDPYAGLIVQLNSLKAEIISDRRQFRAWIRGAVSVLSVVFGIVTIAAPWVRDFITALLKVHNP